jgi:hypothetical protein
MRTLVLTMAMSMSLCACGAVGDAARPAEAGMGPYACTASVGPGIVGVWTCSAPDSCLYVFRADGTACFVDDTPKQGSDWPTSFDDATYTVEATNIILTIWKHVVDRDETGMPLGTSTMQPAKRKTLPYYLSPDSERLGVHVFFPEGEHSGIVGTWLYVEQTDSGTGGVGTTTRIQFRSDGTFTTFATPELGFDAKEGPYSQTGEQTYATAKPEWGPNQVIVTLMDDAVLAQRALVRQR